jgi:hypothetical protein
VAYRKLTRPERTAQALRNVQSRLPGTVAEALHALDQSKPPSALGLLRAWRRLGRLATITTHDRAVLRTAFAQAFTRLLHQAATGGAKPFRPADFGVRGYRELAELFITMLERVGYANQKLSQLRRIRQILIGEMLEVLVRNARELQDGLLGMAHGQRQLLLRFATKLVDARGDPVPAPRSIGAPVRAMDMAVTGSGHPLRKFIDFGYVSIGVWPDGRTFISFLVETEIKMPAAARKAGPQIGRAQVRFDMQGDDVLTVTVDGVVKTFTADQIVFSPGHVNRTLVTIGATPNFRPRHTRAGGEDEAYWQIDLEMAADSLRRLVGLAIP